MATSDSIRFACRHCRGQQAVQRSHSFRRRESGVGERRQADRPIECPSGRPTMDRPEGPGGSGLWLLAWTDAQWARSQPQREAISIFCLVWTRLPARRRSVSEDRGDRSIFHAEQPPARDERIQRTGPAPPCRLTRKKERVIPPPFFSPFISAPKRFPPPTHAGGLASRLTPLEEPLARNAMSPSWKPHTKSESQRTGILSTAAASTTPL